MFPHSNAHYSTSSYNMYSHLTSLSREGQVYFTTGLTNTHAEFSSVHLSSHALVTAGDCSSLGCMIMTPEGCQCAPVTRRLHFLGKMSVQILHKLSGPFYSLTEETAKTHFLIGNWINIKNIYTCISTIYHTALIKSGFSGCKYLCSIWKCAYFPDAQICKRIEWYRKIIWTHM